MTISRNDALIQIASLIQTHNFSKNDIDGLFAATHGTNTESGGLLQHVMMYIGGALIFMGVCIYINMIWDDLNSLSRVIITLGSGFIAFILGLFCLSDTRFHRAATPLFIIAAGLQPSGLFIFMDEYLPKTGDVLKAACAVFGLMTLQQAAAFIATKRTCLLFFAVFFFYSLLICIAEWLHVDTDATFLILGITGLMVSYGIARTEHYMIANFFFFWASLFTAFSAFELLENGPLDVLLIGIASALIYLSVVVQSRVVLAVGVLSLLGFIGYFTDKYFKDIVGWPIAIILMGFIMIGVSVYAVKLGRKINHQTP